MKAAVLGSPIGHSLSPALHRAAYRALGLDGWSYQAVECTEPDLPAWLAGCGPEWAGVSLTMPLKRAVLSLLDEAGPLVAEVGAANTVVFDGGLRRGRNTDVPGMVAALTEALAPPGGHDPQPAAGRPARQVTALIEDRDPAVLILGAGATACSALAAVRGLGLTGATVAVRDPGRAADLRSAAERMGMSIRLAPFARPAGRAPGVLISTVPSGAADQYAQRILAGTLAPRCLLDVVYHPWPTQLAAAGQQAGVPVAGGLALLLHQAVGQVELMTGKPAPVAAMREALPRARGQPGG
jgi:shikimate dehydrogenase